MFHPSFFVVAWNQTNTFVCCVLLQRYCSPQLLIFYIHALMRAARNFSLLRRKTAPSLHITGSFFV